MAKFVSILRGINVSGQKKIVMTELAALYEEIGFRDVQTYIQSGNVIFTFDERATTRDMAKLIKDAILDKYNFEVPTLVYANLEMTEISTNNPFIYKTGIDITKLHVTFLPSVPKAENLAKLEAIDTRDEQFVLKDRNMYVYCPNGYGRAKLNNNFIERKLKVEATTRSWKTVNKLVEILNN